MTQNDLASMNINRKPINASRPRINGAFLDANFSESHEIGGVAAVSDNLFKLLVRFHAAEKTRTNDKTK